MEHKKRPSIEIYSHTIQNCEGGENFGEKTIFWILSTFSFITNIVKSAMKQLYNCGVYFIQFQRSFFSPKVLVTSSKKSMEFKRDFSSLRITKNLELVTKGERTSVSHDKILTKDSKGHLLQNDSPPLCILMSWLLSKRKHLMNYANVYLDKGFDVLTVRCDMTQYMFPSSGSGAQMVAKDLVKFIVENPHYEKKTIVHGFSGSAYFWGEVLTLLNREPEKYQDILNGWIVGQIWDSPAGFAEIAPTFGTAVFPNSYILQNVMRVYATLHMKFLYEQATKHYNEARNHYEDTKIKCPALILCSENDPISLYSYVQSVVDKWVENGMDVRLKGWKESPHVSHMWSHPEAYRLELNNFIQKLGLHNSTSLPSKL